MTLVKICGLKDPGMVTHAASSGADFIGFVFVPQSPRAITVQAAANLLMYVADARPVALVSDADDQHIDAIVDAGIKVLQLHGSEPPERVTELKARTGCEVWKAVGIASGGDLRAAQAYSNADRILLDAKPPAGAEHSGGHGAPFDWRLLKQFKPVQPWMLAGGLTPDNVAIAIAVSGADAVDVSSGVERVRGLKDRAMIEAFIKAAKRAE